MMFEVRVAAHGGGDATRFEIERDEAPAVGDYLRQLNMLYQVTRVLPGNENFDAILEAEWRAGPTQASYTGS